MLDMITSHPIAGAIVANIRLTARPGSIAAGEACGGGAPAPAAMGPKAATGVRAAAGVAAPEPGVAPATQANQVPGCSQGAAAVGLEAAA
jgi:hypothetical protein